jgi:hypothetical protein
VATFEPVHIGGDPVEEEREPFFDLDGVEYTIPKHIKPATTLKLLDLAASQGEAAASGWLMRELLGDDAVDALQESDAITDDQMAVLWGYIEKKMLAARRKQLGNGRGGSRR